MKQGPNADGTVYLIGTPKIEVIREDSIRKSRVAESQMTSGADELSSLEYAR